MQEILSELMKKEITSAYKEGFNNGFKAGAKTYLQAVKTLMTNKEMPGIDLSSLNLILDVFLEQEL